MYGMHVPGKKAFSCADYLIYNLIVDPQTSPVSYVGYLSIFYRSLAFRGPLLWEDSPCKLSH